MTLSKNFKILSLMGILGGLFLNASTGAMPSSWEAKEKDGKAVAIQTTIQMNGPSDQDEFQTLLRFSRMSVSELAQYEKTTKEFNITQAPKGWEDAFDDVFKSLENSFTIKSGTEMRLVPLRGGKEDFLRWMKAPDNLKNLRLHPYEFLNALSQRHLFLGKGLSSFLKIREGQVGLRRDESQETSRVVPLRPFGFFSEESPREDSQPEKDFLSGLTWWIMRGDSPVGVIGSVVTNLVQGSEVPVPLQCVTKLSIFPEEEREFSPQDREDVASFFEKKMRSIKGGCFGIPKMQGEDKKEILQTSVFKFTKEKDLDGGGYTYQIGVETKSNDITSIDYPNKKDHFNLLFGKLEGAHDLPSGKKIELTPFKGGIQFKDFGPFFGRDPSEAAAQFSRTVERTHAFFNQELLHFVVFPTRSGEKPTIIPLNQFSVVNSERGSITSHRADIGGLTWFVQSDSEPLGRVTLKQTHQTEILDQMGLALTHQIYSFDYSFRADMGLALGMNFDPARDAILGIFKDKWWPEFRSILG